jgi:hypothetical protein
VRSGLRAFFFKRWTSASGPPHSVVGSADTGLKFANATPNGRPAQACDLRHGNNTATSLPQCKQTRKQASLAFVERGNNAINGLVVPRILIKQTRVAMRTTALMNCAILV